MPAISGSSDIIEASEKLTVPSAPPSTVSRAATSTPNVARGTTTMIGPSDLEASTRKASALAAYGTEDRVPVN